MTAMLDGAEGEAMVLGMKVDEAEVGEQETREMAMTRVMQGHPI